MNNLNHKEKKQQKVLTVKNLKNFIFVWFQNQCSVYLFILFNLNLMETNIVGGKTVLMLYIYIVVDLLKFIELLYSLHY